MKICISKDAYNTKEEAVAAVNIAKRNEYREKYNKKDTSKQNYNKIYNRHNSILC